jgi:hypothetical protein
VSRRTTFYRAVAQFWHSEQGEQYWRGRWQSESRARAQLARWLEREDVQIEEAWVERFAHGRRTRVEEAE